MAPPRTHGGAMSNIPGIEVTLHVPKVIDKNVEVSAVVSADKIERQTPDNAGKRAKQCRTA